MLAYKALIAEVEQAMVWEKKPCQQCAGVGRIRGRVLFNSGLRTLDDLKKTSISKLTSLPFIGPQIAKRIKEQVGGFIRTEELQRYRDNEISEQKALSDY